MATLTIVKFFFQLFLVFVGAYALLHEKELARLERKAVKYIKAFFKAIYLSVKEKNQTPAEPVALNVQGNIEYEEMLARLNKAAKIEDVLVA